MKSFRRIEAHDDYDTEGYLESAAFAKFAIKVRSVIHGPTTIGEMKRALGEKCIDRWLMDAIDSLVGAGAITECWGLPSRWERSDVKPRQAGYDTRISINPPSVRRPDSFKERTVTA